MPQTVRQVLNMRQAEILRLHTRANRADQDFEKTNSALEKISENLPGTVSASEKVNQYNPKVFRAEIRDSLHLKARKAFKKFKKGEAMTQQSDLTEFRVRQELGTPPDPRLAQRPTGFRFMRILLSDPHVSLADALDGTGKVRSAVVAAAELMVSFALAFPHRKARTATYQKLQIALALVDASVEAVLSTKQSTDAFDFDGQVALQRVKLGPRTPFAGRQLDAFAFESFVRSEDYKRWMKAADPTFKRPREIWELIMREKTIPKVKLAKAAIRPATLRR
jgi:hypothetical protein